MVRTCRGAPMSFLPMAIGLGIVVLSVGWTDGAVAQGLADPGSGATRTHVVAEGETLGRIARRYDITVAALEAANDLADADQLRIGQSLTIPATTDVDGDAGGLGRSSGDEARDRDRAAARRNPESQPAAPVPAEPTTGAGGAGSSAESSGRPEGRSAAQRGSRAASRERSDSSVERASPAGEAGEETPEAQVTRRGVVLHVAAGQTLSDIAGSYGVGVSRILRANDLEDADALRAGQRLLVPGATEVVEVRRVRREDPGSRPITFLRVSTDEEETIRLFDRRGRPISSARDRVDRLFRQPSTNRQHRINTELLRLIQRVADHWPGKRIWIYSGYRPYRRSQYTPKSKHNTGHALDFRVEGVPNGELRDYCRSLRTAGVGFYPNSHFVHLDARDRRAYWVDYSGPGEAPRYGRERPAEGEDDGGEAAADREAGEEAGGRRGGRGADEAAEAEATPGGDAAPAAASADGGEGETGAAGAGEPAAVGAGEAATAVRDDAAPAAP